MLVGVIGPESTGKSTLSWQLAAHFHGTCVGEYARTYVENLHRAYTYKDVENIAQYQIKQLAEISEKNQKENTLYFFDTELIITKVWFWHKYGTCPAWVETAIKNYPLDMYLLCYPDLEWIADPVRENPHIRQELFEEYQNELEQLHIPYYIIKGYDKERFGAAKTAIEPYVILT